MKTRYFYSAVEQTLWKVKNRKITCIFIYFNGKSDWMESQFTNIKELLNYENCVEIQAAEVALLL